MNTSQINKHEIIIKSNTSSIYKHRAAGRLTLPRAPPYLGMWGMYWTHFYFIWIHLGYMQLNICYFYFIVIGFDYVEDCHLCPSVPWFHLIIYLILFFGYLMKSLIYKSYWDLGSQSQSPEIPNTWMTSQHIQIKHV